MPEPTINIPTFHPDYLSGAGGIITDAVGETPLTASQIHAAAEAMEEDLATPTIDQDIWNQLVRRNRERLEAEQRAEMARPANRWTISFDQDLNPFFEHTRYGAETQAAALESLRQGLKSEMRACMQDVNRAMNSLKSVKDELSRLDRLTPNDNPATPERTNEPEILNDTTEPVDAPRRS